MDFISHLAGATRERLERIHTIEAAPLSWGAMCRNKRCHETMEQAVLAAGKMNVKTGGERFNAYKCPFGNHYHIGHQIGQKPKRFQ